MSERIVYIPSTIMPNFTSLNSLVTCLWGHKFISKQNTETIYLDFKSTNFFSSELTVLLGICFEEFNHKEIPFVMDGMKPAIKNTLSRTGFLQKYNQEIIRTEKRYDTSLEYIKFDLDITSTVDVIYERIITYLEEHIFTNDLWQSTGNAESMSKIKNAISELVDNIITHSSSDILLFAGQLFPQKKKFRFSICDAGIGIANGVSEKANVSFDSERINWAVQEGHTTRDEKIEGPRGLGIYMICNAIDNVGTVTIISNSGYWRKYFNSCKKTIIETKELQTFFPGTLIHLEFSLDDTQFENKSSLNESFSNENLSF